MVAPKFQPPGIQNIPSFEQFQAQQRGVGDYNPAKFDTFTADPGRLRGVSGSPFNPNGSVNPGWSVTLAGGGPQGATAASASPNPTNNGAALQQTTVNQGLYSGGRAAWDAADMGDLGGARYDPNQGWVPTGQALGPGYKLGQTGATLPIGYNATQDLDRHEWSGKYNEPSWRRVNRWAGDFQAAGYDPQTAYNMALSRLKWDYENSPQGPRDWRRSGFDLTNVQASQGGMAYAQGGQIGGGAPAGTVGAASPAVSNPAAGGGGGTVGVASPPVSNPAPSLPGGGASEVQAGYYLDKPDYALKAALRARGIDVDQKGLVGSYMRAKYLEPMKAIAAAAGLTGGGNANAEIEGLMNRFGAALTGRAGGLGDLGQELANAILSNPALADQSDEDLMQLMETIGFLGNMDQNQYIAAGNKNRYQDVISSFEDRFFQGLNGGDMPTFQEFMQQRGFRPF